MKRTLALLGALAVTGAMASTAISDENSDTKAAQAAVKARQSQMQLYAFNIGLLGGMAKGEIDYDADAAAKAAGNLAALTRLDQSRMWPPGSDNFELGDDVTAALPALWSTYPEVVSKGKALGEAAAAMEQAAGGGLESLRGAIGPLGKACGSCHKAYRQPKD